MSSGPLVSIEVDQVQLEVVRRQLGGFSSQANKVLVTAINKTLRDAQSAVATELTKILNVKRNNIRKRMKVRTAERSGGELVGRMTIMARKIGLVNFGAKDLRPRKLRGSRVAGSGRGVTAQIFKGGPMVRLPHAFIAAGSHGNKHVFERSHVQVTAGGVTTSGVRSKRLPIDRVQGLSLKDVYDARPDMHSMTKAVIDRKLDGYIRSQVRWILQKNGQAVPLA